MTDDRFPVPVRGVDVDDETRCDHYDDPVDVVALRFGCCETYYPCYACHEAVADHPAEPWPNARFDESAVLCGGCLATLTARKYFDATAADGSRDACPWCGIGFNPGCRQHRDRYFER